MKRLLWFSIILLLALVVWFIGWGSSGEKEIRTAILPDGKPFTIEAVTFGKVHTYGGPWEKLFTRILPTNLTAQLGIKVSRITRNEDVMILWMGTNLSGSMPVTIRAVDDQGHEGKSAGLRGGTGLVLYEVSWFPRRARMIKFRAYWGQSQRDQFIEFLIKNPAYKKYPEWKPEPLPITKRVGAEQFTLTAFHTGLYSIRGMAGETPTWSELEFRNGPPEAPTGPWQPVGFSIRDATGNAKEDRSPRGVMAANEAALKAIVARNPTFDWRSISEPGMLWLDEPAWKIDVTWIRTRGYPFRPDELWIVRDITNPAPHSFTQINARTNPPTGSLLVKGISAAQTIYPGEKVSNDAAIHVKFERTDTNALADLIRVTDDRGSNIIFNPPPRGYPASTYSLPRLTTNSKTLDLTFAFHRKYQVQFFAKPTLLHTNIEKNN